MSDNPLRAYFRRPAIYFKLPSEGKFYGPGVINTTATGELPVYPMTTTDELTIRNPDGMFNGESTVRVIKNCIPDIIDPWQLNDSDMEAVIIAIRAASEDGKLEIMTTCPSCSEETKYDVDLLKMLAERQPVDYSRPLVIGDLTVRFKPLSYAETNKNSLLQFEIQREVAMIDDIEDEEQKKKIMSANITKLSEIMLRVISQTIESIQTPEVTVTDHKHIQEFLTECDSKTHRIIKDYSVELKKQNESKPLNVVCPSCNTKFEQSLVLNFTDFFE